MISYYTKNLIQGDSLKRKLLQSVKMSRNIHLNFR